MTGAGRRAVGALRARRAHTSGWSYRSSRPVFLNSLRMVGEFLTIHSTPAASGQGQPASAVLC